MMMLVAVIDLLTPYKILTLFSAGFTTPSDVPLAADMAHPIKKPSKADRHFSHTFQHGSESDTDFEAGDLMGEPSFDDQEYTPELPESAQKEGQWTSMADRKRTQVVLTGWGVESTLAIN